MEESALDLEVGWPGASAGQAAGRREMTSLAALTAGDTSAVVVTPVQLAAFL